MGRVEALNKVILILTEIFPSVFWYMIFKNYNLETFSAYSASSVKQNLNEWKFSNTNNNIYDQSDHLLWVT